MGKAPIQRMLERKGLRLSVATVGRILSRAIAGGCVPCAGACEGRLKPGSKDLVANACGHGRRTRAKANRATMVPVAPRAEGDAPNPR